jgi:hypothetical protein
MIVEKRNLKIATTIANDSEISKNIYVYNYWPPPHAPPQVRRGKVTDSFWKIAY